MRVKDAPSLQDQLQSEDLFATFELPGPKWRLPDGEIPEADIKVHRGQLRGTAKKSPERLFGRNPGSSLQEIGIC